MQLVLCIHGFWIHEYNRGLETVFPIHLLELVDVEGQLYALFYTILYKDPEHPRVLVSTGVLETILHGYWRTTVITGS